MFKASEMLKKAGVANNPAVVAIGIDDTFYRVSEELAEEMMKLILAHLDVNDGQVLLATGSIFNAPISGGPSLEAPVEAEKPAEKPKKGSITRIAKKDEYPECTAPKAIEYVWDDAAHAVGMGKCSRDAWAVAKNMLVNAGFKWDGKVSHKWIAGPELINVEDPTIKPVKITKRVWDIFKKGMPTVATVDQLKAVHDEWAAKEKKAAKAAKEEG